MADREQTEPSDQAQTHDAATLGNRPATGARVMHQTQPPPSSFGGMEAADFLGLSQELAGLAPGAPVETGTPSALPAETPTGDVDNSASWLLSLDEPHAGAEPGLEPAAVVEEPAPSERRSFGFGSLAAAGLIIGAAVVIAMKFGTGKDATPSSGPIVQTSPPPRARVGATHEPVSRPNGGTSTAADTSATTAPGGATPIADTGTPAPDVAITTGPTASTDPPTNNPADSGIAVPTPAPDLVASASSPRAGERRFAEWMSARGWSSAEGTAESVGAQDPISEGGPRPMPIPVFLTLVTSPYGTLPAADPAESAAYRSTDPAESAAYRPTGSSSDEFAPTTTAVAVDAPAPRSTPRAESASSARIANLRLATEEDLAGIWDGDTIPFDALGGDARLLTPAVGNVRVVLKTGEIFDGRLYAIGQGQVWLESDLGRLALAGQRVQNIDVAVASDTKKLESLPRMRVRTPGGLFFGKIVARDDRRVTLVTEDGARIVLESTDVEPAPLAETRVVGPVKP